MDVDLLFSAVVQKNLGRNEVLVADASCLVAMTSSVELELKYAAPLKRAFFGVSDDGCKCVLVWAEWMCSTLPCPEDLSGDAFMG